MLLLLVIFVDFVSLTILGLVGQQVIAHAVLVMSAVLILLITGARARDLNMPITQMLNPYASSRNLNFYIDLFTKDTAEGTTSYQGKSRQRALTTLFFVCLLMISILAYLIMAGVNLQ